MQQRVQYVLIVLQVKIKDLNKGIKTQHQALLQCQRVLVKIKDLNKGIKTASVSRKSNSTLVLVKIKDLNKGIKTHSLSSYHSP